MRTEQEILRELNETRRKRGAKEKRLALIKELNELHKAKG